jgi:hypothetical protein
MNVSRRDFISTAAASVTGVCLSAAKVFPVAAPLAQPSATYGLIDLGSECVLRESLLGYQAALAATNSSVQPLRDVGRAHRCLIVPGAGAISESTAERLLPLLENGAQVLLESAAGFCDSQAFAAHQQILSRYFDLTLEPPVHLWSFNGARHTASRSSHRITEVSSTQHTPYIDYVWPAKLSVRDFSRVIPVSAEPSHVIAYAGHRPIAVRKSVARGTLIFLGSPLGPGLRAGEPQAHAWLQLVLPDVSGAEGGT